MRGTKSNPLPRIKKIDNKLIEKLNNFIKKAVVNVQHAFASKGINKNKKIDKEKMDNQLKIEAIGRACVFIEYVAAIVDSQAYKKLLVQDSPSVEENKIKSDLEEFKKLALEMTIYINIFYLHTDSEKLNLSSHFTTISKALARLGGFTNYPLSQPQNQLLSEPNPESKNTNNLDNFDNIYSTMVVNEEAEETPDCQTMKVNDTEEDERKDVNSNLRNIDDNDSSNLYNFDNAYSTRVVNKEVEDIPECQTMKINDIEEDEPVDVNNNLSDVDDNSSSPPNNMNTTRNNNEQDSHSENSHKPPAIATQTVISAVSIGMPLAHTDKSYRVLYRVLYNDIDPFYSPTVEKIKFEKLIKTIKEFGGIKNYLTFLYEKGDISIRHYIEVIQHESMQADNAKNIEELVDIIKAIAQLDCWKGQKRSYLFWKNGLAEVPQGISEIKAIETNKLEDFAEIGKSRLKNGKQFLYQVTGLRNDMTLEFYQLIISLNENEIKEDYMAGYIAIKAFCQKWAIPYNFAELTEQTDFISREGHLLKT